MANKDQQGDEVDSVMISISVPKALKEISKGRLRSVVNKDDGYTTYNWFVSNPINNYDITFYIGNYAHWTDSYEGENGPLSLDYWSLKEDSRIHTIWQLIGEDEKFRNILKGLNKTFYHQTVTNAQVENHIIKQSRLKLSLLFDQYLRTTQVPVLNYRITEGKLSYCWINIVNGFNMPVKVTLAPNTLTFIYPTSQWKEIKTTGIDDINFQADPNFYVLLKKQ